MPSCAAHGLGLSLLGISESGDYLESMLKMMTGCKYDIKQYSTFLKQVIEKEQPQLCLFFHFIFNYLVVNCNCYCKGKLPLLRYEFYFIVFLCAGWLMTLHILYVNSIVYDVVYLNVK